MCMCRYTAPDEDSAWYVRPEKIGEDWESVGVEAEPGDVEPSKVEEPVPVDWPVPQKAE